MQEDFLKFLNKEQFKAVTYSGDKALLVLAGAGSGKTRVLINRILWFLKEKQVNPYNILAVTFTNKSANEIKKRLTEAVDDARNIFAGTFHSISLRILRDNSSAAQISNNFQIIDEKDQERLIKRILEKHNYLDSQEVSIIRKFINSCKEDTLRSVSVTTYNKPKIQKAPHLLEIYKEYEHECQKQGLVDFDEILLKTYELLRDNREIREHYQERFKIILVDEFQDTNHLQYQWLKLLNKTGNGLMVVGDDDQSIYGFRGAKITNILNFQKEFDAEIIKLEQNYRSVQSILKIANTVIEENTGRIGKKMFSGASSDEKAEIVYVDDLHVEAKFISSQILAMKSNDLKNIAVLYRTSRQSRLIEEQLFSYNIPYVIYGGFRFFDREEIKDVLAYLSLFVNPANDLAFLRIINKPLRKIGKKTLQILMDIQVENELSLWDAINFACLNQKINKSSIIALQTLQNSIIDLQQRKDSLNIYDTVKEVINLSGICTFYEKEQDRLDNIEELLNSIKERDDQQFENISEFLEYTMLYVAQKGSVDNAVQIMTIHSSKGLEFSTVFLSGVIDGIIPHFNSFADSMEMEEERRLIYVAITRAKHRIFLMVPRMSFNYQYAKPSRFLQKILNLTDIVNENYFDQRFI